MLSPTDVEALVAAARQSSEHAYAPYSLFNVGAAVRDSKGRIYSAANVENASYGLSLCAERNAVIAAVLDGAERLEALAVFSSTSPPAAPCGMCRQTLAEFADELTIILANSAGDRLETSLTELLPRAFRGKDLP